MANQPLLTDLSKALMELMTPVEVRSEDPAPYGNQLLTGRSAKIPTKGERRETETALVRELADFLPHQQRDFLLELLRSKSYEFEYTDLLQRLIETVKKMPHSYQTDGQGDQAIVYLHYFVGSCDWWIIEKDKNVFCEPDERQNQAFGLASLGYGAELGYISIAEIRSHGQVELDFHWRPKTVAEVKAKL